MNRQLPLPGTRRCGKNPTPAQALCSVCCRLFGGVRAFDIHRKDGRCLDPGTVGLTEESGVWRDLSDRLRLENLRRARSASTVAAVAEKTAKR